MFILQSDARISVIIGRDDTASIASTVVRVYAEFMPVYAVQCAALCVRRVI